jgi:lysophospholipase L1-like esterase
VKGQTHGKDVAILGESFIALSTIPTELETLAKAQGSLPSSEKYVNNAVSGTTIAGANGNVDQYNKAVASSGTIKYVIMDGGGNDCLQANNPTQALTGADKLFTLMAQKGTEKVVYFFYPDPIGSSFGNLKTCLDTLRPMMKAKCDGLTSPKCYWLDLRPTWNGHNEYTNDGIHPTAAGSKATAAAVWPVAVANCVAQ